MRDGENQLRPSVERRSPQTATSGSGDARSSAIEALNSDLEAEKARVHKLEAELKKAQSAFRALNTARDRELAHLSAVEFRLASIEKSTIWRSSRPLRDAVEESARILAPVKGWARLLYWILTPARMPSRYRTIRALNRENGQGWLVNMRQCLFDTGGPRSEPAQALDSVYKMWIEHHDTLDETDRSAIQRHIQALAYQPKISIVVPVYNTPLDVLQGTITSVLSQLYTNWELCIADDCSSEPHVAKVLKAFAETDHRIKCIFRTQNGHIAEASNSALTLASGEFIALLDHDDLLPDHALYEVVVELNAHPTADLIFSDEDKIDENGRRYDPYFKPDFSLDLLLGQNVVNHFGVYRKTIVDQIKGFRSGFDGSQDYDLTLRAVARTSAEKIRHIPAILYHWRQTEAGGSFSQEYLEQCVQTGQRAVSEFVNLGADRPNATVSRISEHISWNRVRWPTIDPEPLVSIIIPTRDRAELVRQCVEGLIDRTAYRHFEIFIVDNDSVEPETLDLLSALQTDSRVKVLRVEGPFNFSALNNAAAREARGEILLLLNNDIDVIEPHWLSEMINLTTRSDVGIVGAKLLYADGRVQHAGVRLGAGQFDGGPGIAGHLGLLRDRNDPGYFGLLALTRDVGAVTGACLAIRRSLYQQVGGLDELNLQVAFNDVDLCLKVRDAGYRVLWTPFAELYHLESASRGSDTGPDNLARFHQECRHMQQRWGQTLQNDPFYNPAFDNYQSDFKLAFQPRRRKPWQVEMGNGEDRELSPLRQV